MGSAKDFSAINTKISHMKKNLLNKDAYDEILNSKSIKDITNFLYNKNLIDSKEQNFPNEVELSLKKGRLSLLNRLKPYLSSNYSNIVDLILDKYYIEDIKKAVRSILIKKNNIKKQSFIVREDFSQMINDGINLDEFFEKLKDTKFYNYIRGYKNQDKSDLIFFTEMSLDRNYFTNIYIKSESLKKDNKKFVKDFYGEFIDLYNISWIYRAKKFYNMPSIIIFNYSIMGGSIFNINKIKDLSYISLEEFIDYISKTKYEFLFNSELDIDLYMERRINRYLYYKSKDFINSNKFDFSKTLGLILTSEFDIKDINTILEGKSFNMKKDDIEKYLIRNFKEMSR